MSILGLANRLSIIRLIQEKHNMLGSHAIGHKNTKFSENVEQYIILPCLDIKISSQENYERKENCNR